MVKTEKVSEMIWDVVHYSFSGGVQFIFIKAKEVKIIFNIIIVLDDMPSFKISWNSSKKSHRTNLTMLRDARFYAHNLFLYTVNNINEEYHKHMNFGAFKI